MIQQLLQRHPALRPFLKEVLVLESHDPPRPRHSFRFFADGYPGIVFQQAARGCFLDGPATPLSSVFLYGQTVQPVQLTAQGSYRMLFFFLHPHAIRPLLGLKADGLTNTCLDLSFVPNPSGTSLSEQLLNAGSVAEQVEQVAQYVLRMIGRNGSQTDPLLNGAVQRIQTTNGRIPLSELQNTLRLSERTFERRFEQYIGISPRLFSRICRFQATLRQLKSRQYGKLSDIAFDHGYADQSHFIRTFREFTGFSPLQFDRFPAERIPDLSFMA